MSEPSAMPQRKVVAGGLAGSIVSLALWCLSEFAGVVMPGEQAAALTTIVSFGLAYLVPNAPAA